MEGKLKLVIAMLIYGSIGVFVKNIKLSALEIAFFRAAIGSIFLISVSWIMGGKIRSISKKDLMIFSVSGAALGINWLFLFKAFEYTSVSTAILVYYLAPVIVILLSPVVLRERLTMTKLICSFVAVTGLSMVILSDYGKETLSGGSFVGIVFALAAALFYASVILINKSYKSPNGFETTKVQLVASVLVLLPLILKSGGFEGMKVDLNSLILIVILGILHTGIAYLLYFSSMKNLSAQTVAIYCYIDPISAMVFAWVLLGERMNPIQMIGGALILGATYFIDKNGSMSLRINGQLGSKNLERNEKATDSSISQSYFINHYQKMF